MDTVGSVQNPEHFLLNVELFPFASSTRNAYLSATTATASVKVTVRELQLSGAQCTGDSQTLDNPLCTITVLPTVLGSMTLNLDPTNPPYEAGDATTTTESHDPTLSDPVTSSPFVSNPFVSNPFVSNPFVSNPFVSNPFVSNPFVSNATVYDITDLTWTVGNGGNTTSSYISRLNLGDLDQLAGNYAFQLLIYKRVYSAGVTNCEPVNVPFDQLISSVPNPFVSNIQIDNPFVSNPFVSNPFVSNPFVSNATFAEAPPSGGTGDFHDGTRHDYRPDQVLVTLRAYQLKPTAQLTAKFDPVDNPPSLSCTRTRGTWSTVRSRARRRSRSRVRIWWPRGCSPQPR